jgi:glycine cleavage system protein P-like pyridoxal-binding family
VNYTLAPKKESRVDGNIKATYGNVSYLARKWSYLLRCIGNKRKFSGQKKWKR